MAREEQINVRMSEKEAKFVDVIREKAGFENRSEAVRYAIHRTWLGMADADAVVEGGDGQEATAE